MATIFSGLLDGQQTGIGKVLVGDKPQKDNRETVDVIASVFFDGTGNNRTNTETRMKARLENTKARYAVVQGRVVKLRDSYGCFYSNVAIMEYMLIKEDQTKEVSIYIEGIGTQNGLDDDQMGSGFGAGETGIPKKVTKGIAELTVAIEKMLRTTNKKLETLTVNAFGFSRGAAAARHFVARCGNQQFPALTSLSESLCLAAEAITVNFVGLFDSVSSYGGEAHTTTAGQLYHHLRHKSFDDDVAELGLALGGAPKQVVQLAAADEYRQNFASTTITTSVRAGVGLEVRLPGVHSDVGGSYEEEKQERRYCTAAEQARLLDEGWYLPAQLVPVDESGAWYKGTRTLTHHYQLIPLAIMAELAKQSGMTFEPFRNDNADYVVPAPLAPLAGQMRAFVLARPGPHSQHPYVPAAFALPAEFAWVRNQYLHRSAVKGDLSLDSLTMAGREVHRLPQRQVISDAG